MTLNTLNNNNKNNNNRCATRLIWVMLVFLSGVTSVGVQAKNIGIYTDVGVMYNRVKVNNGKFYPWSGKIKLGYNFTKNFSIEGQYGTSFKGDTDQGVSLDLNKAMGAYVRWGSDTHNNVRLYILLGQSRSVVDFSGNDKHSETLDGFSWAIGAEERSQKFKSMSYTVEYTSFYRKSGQEISGLSLGLRFDF